MYNLLSVYSTYEISDIEYHSTFTFFLIHSFLIISTLLILLYLYYFSSQIQKHKSNTMKKR